jgi:type IV fimbrial biogenesis protein FimT
MKSARGFTIVELMITVAVVAVLATLAAPSLYDFILVQRLKSINAQLVTDMQFARSEAVSRFEARGDDASQSVDVQVIFRPAANGATMSCYSIYTDSSANPRNRCDCTQPPGLRCPAASTQEIRTVQILTSQGVRQHLPANQARGFSYLSTTGAIRVWPIDITVATLDFTVETFIDANRTLRTTIGLSGRPSVCSPDGGVSGYTPC